MSEAAPPVRYILNLDSKVVHRVLSHAGRSYTLEVCNVDQLTHAQKSDEIPHGFRRCEHCFTEPVAS